MPEVPIPPGVPVARFQPMPRISIPDGTNVPLFSSQAPVEQRIQEHWKAHVRIFRLQDVKDLQDYEAVWQRVTDGQALVSESRVDFYDGAYVAFLRWVEFIYTLPPESAHMPAPIPGQ